MKMILLFFFTSITFANSENIIDAVYAEIKRVDLKMCKPMAYDQAEGYAVECYFKNESSIHAIAARNTGWGVMDPDEKADLLYNVCEGFDVEIPKGLKPVKPLQGLASDVSIYEKYDGDYGDYINRLFGSVIKTADRESIEQSPYMSNGDPTVSSLCLLIDEGSQLVLGSYITVFQGGLDENGEEADISWTFRMRADSEARLLVNESGGSYDDQYYEWSGH